MRRCIGLLLLSSVAVWGFLPAQHVFRRVLSLPTTSKVIFRQSFPTKHSKVSHWMSSEHDEKNDELVEQRKILTMVGYRFSSLVYMFLGIFIIGWQGSKSIARLPMACYFSAGPMLAAGVSYVLEGAAVNDRLANETFKRLNLFLAQYGAAWLLAAYLIRHTGPRMVTNPLVLAASTITVFNSVRAWTFGVKGWEEGDAESRILDLMSTIGKYLKLMFSIKSFPGSVYLFGALLFSGLKIAKLIELYHMLASGGVGLSVFPKDIFRVSVYSLLSAVMVTLKDGGDRGRLTGSSYVELNTVATFVLGSMGAYFYNLGSIALGAATAFLSFYAGTMGFLTFREKRQRLL